MNMSTADAVACVCDEPSILGEGPIWVARENSVYWVDIRGRRLHRLELQSGAHRFWAMPEPICWVAEREGQPGFIAGLGNGFARLQPEPLEIDVFGVPEPDLPDNRFNDAAVDRTGCIWAGTMDDNERVASGALYRLDPSGSWVQRDSGYIVSNGPSFSPDHDVLYHTDSAKRVVYRFSLSPDGSLGDREVFVEFPEEWGAPDGMATDTTGGVWIAHWGGGRVSRFMPDGTLDRWIAVPASQVTSCCFGGAELDQLFITTAAIGREDEPLAGCLFQAHTGVRGARVYAYGG